MSARATFSVLAHVTLCVVLAACSEDPKAPTLLPLSPVTTRVNEALVLQLVVDNPDGLALRYRYVGPELPSLSLTATLSGTPSGGEFRWTPLASHVGEHQFDFTVESDAGSSSRSVLVTVEPESAAAPIFIEPGSGDTFDLAVTPCLTVPIEVKDDDSAEVTIGQSGGLPEGATIARAGPKRAELRWCPSAAQRQQSLTWRMRLTADDGAHTPTEQPFLVVLRNVAAADCPGAAPVVDVAAPALDATVVQAGGFPVRIEVTDDLGVRDPPVLYYRMTAPETDGGIANAEQVLFAPGDGATWEALIPPLGLAVGASAPVWYAVSAVDNDDATGTACDHRTDTPWRSFIAKNDGATAAVCGFCQDDAGCASGFCAADGRCVARCDECPGPCVPTTSTTGGVRESCGGSAACTTASSSRDACVPDNFVNGSVEDALSLLAGPLSGALCEPGEYDYYSHLNGPEGLVTIALKDLDKHDLDFMVLDTGLLALALSSTASATETATICMPPSSELFVQVYAYGAGPTPWGRYEISAVFEPGPCCEADANEPSDAPSQATPLTDGVPLTGTLCLQDADWFTFDVAGPGEASLAFEYEGAGLAFVTVVGPLPSAKIVKESIAVQGPSITTAWLPAAGTYAVSLVPYEIKTTVTYSVALSIAAAGPCLFTYDCPLGQVCEDESQCVPDACDLDEPACPLGHACTPEGPELDGMCTSICVDDVECRDDRGERCKWFSQDRRCGKAGARAAGEACERFEDCAGEMSCMGWVGGYCAVVGCTSSADCGPDARCHDGDDGPVCMRRCDRPEDPPCRALEGYGCNFVQDTEGTAFSGCMPSISI